MIQRDRIVKNLQELVRIPSHESMEEISSYVAGEISKLGLKPDVDKDGNVLVSIGSGQGLLLNAHLDTVGVNGYKDSFSGEVRDERLYGRGSSDDKSGVAAMLEILRVLKEDPPKKQVIFAFTVWEEGGRAGKDGAYKVAKKVNASHALVMESSVREDGSMPVDIGCKGRYLYTLEVLGKASHSGRPHRGRNAIYLATELIDKLRAMNTPKKDYPGIGEFSSYITVTQIEANEGTNIIPGRCTLTIDYRALPGEGEASVRKSIEKLCSEVLGKGYMLTSVKAKEGFMQTDPDYTGILKRCTESAGLRFSVNLSSGWFDGAVFNESGMKTLNAGPGTRGQAHQNPEYCWIPGLVKGTQAILNVIRGWDVP
jgi:acetylornithine deacetylase/succinyl-diaminopimelate desuccinylase-like protein